MLLSPARRVDTYWPKGLRQLATPPSSCLHSKSLMLTDLTGPWGGGRSSRLLLEDSYHSFFGGGGGGGSYCNQHFLNVHVGPGSELQFFTCTRTPLQPAHPPSRTMELQCFTWTRPPPNPLVKSGGCVKQTAYASYVNALLAEVLKIKQFQAFSLRTSTDV